VSDPRSADPPSDDDAVRRAPDLSRSRHSTFARSAQSMPPAVSHSTSLIVTSLLAVYFAWGSTYLAIRIALTGLPPFLLAGLRAVVAGALLLVWAHWRGQLFTPREALADSRGGASDPRRGLSDSRRALADSRRTLADSRRALAFSREALRNAALVGVLMIGGGNGLVTYAEQWVSSSLAAAIASSGSIWIVAILAFLGERPTRREQIGIAIGFAGVLLLNLDGELRASPLGAAALLGATLSWAVGSVLTRRLVLPLGAAFVAVELLAGGAAMSVFGYLIGERIVISSVPREALLAWIYLVVAGSLVGFSAFNFLIRNVRPALATSFVYVNPVVAVLLGVAIAGEHVSTIGYAGVAVSVLGLVVVTLASRGQR